MGYLRMRGNGWKEGMEAGLGSKGALIPLRPGYLRATPRKTWNAPIGRQCLGNQFSKRPFFGIARNFKQLLGREQGQVAGSAGAGNRPWRFMNTLKFFSL